jgi:hypothetical protein
MVYTRVAPDDQPAWLRVVGSLSRCANRSSEVSALRRAAREPRLSQRCASVQPDGGRRKVKDFTGQSLVPVLVADDEVVHGSEEIPCWAARCTSPLQ